MNPLFLLFLFPLATSGINEEVMLLPVHSYFPDTPIAIKFAILNPNTDYGVKVGYDWHHNFTTEANQTRYTMITIFDRDQSFNDEYFILEFWRLDPLTFCDADMLHIQSEGGFPVEFTIITFVLLVIVVLVIIVAAVIYKGIRKMIVLIKNRRV